jgi:hypothetical protein
VGSLPRFHVKQTGLRLHFASGIHVETSSGMRLASRAKEVASWDSSGGAVGPVCGCETWFHWGIASLGLICCICVPGACRPPGAIPPRVCSRQHGRTEGDTEWGDFC